MGMLTCFKAYDIRGKLGDELNADIALAVGRAFANAMEAKAVVVGRDCRESSVELISAITDGLRQGGADVIDIGLCGTEEVYFATDHLGVDGGMMVTASHNPIDYNGIKMVSAGARPISAETGLADIKSLAEAGGGPLSGRTGEYSAVNIRDDYAAHVVSLVDVEALRPMRLLSNAGNGVAGPAFDAILSLLETRGVLLDVTRLHHAPDGSFPNGIPNPLLPENQPVTANAVREAGADIGIAWDGDFDRCFFFDETGQFIDGEYVVGLLAAAFLGKSPGAKIVHDPRVVLNTRHIIARMGGEAVQSRTGHAFLKAAMRNADAVYGGEMSAHHYFRDFMYCDSGMIPWLLVAEHMGRTGQSLSALVAEMRTSFPSSGEINFRLPDPDKAAAEVEAAFAPDAIGIDRMDGVSLEFETWRFNIRKSNTEPLLRLNVETRGRTELLEDKVA
ncbi:MAG: phosphomannomutase, partial [Pseudomonadota bacterium]